MDDSRLLPEEIIFDILSWLPARSVGQCRCVCRQWRAVLSQAQFMKTHLNHSKLLPHKQDYSLIFFQKDDRFLYSINLSSAHQLFDKNTILPKRLCKASEDTFVIHGSCDGLILVQDRNDFRNPSYFLMNPANRVVRQVPCSPFVPNGGPFYTFAGFGYDSVTDDYNIVTLSYYVAHAENSDEEVLFSMVNIFSVKNNTWREAGSFTFTPKLYTNCSSVFVDGRIHWVACRSLDDHTRVLVAFDWANEKFSEVQIPTLIEEKKHGLSSYWPRLLGGCLCLCSLGGADGAPLQTEVWMMKEYGVQNSWTMLKVNYPVQFTPLCFLSQGQLVLMMDESGLKLVTYNMADGTSKDIVFLLQQPGFVCFETISESLVSPH